MLERFHRTRTCERGADEAQPDRLELAGWELSGRIARPEAMTVAGNDREASDLRIAHQVVDFATLGPRAAVIAAAEIGEAALRPRLLGESQRQVLGIGARVERPL